MVHRITKHSWLSLMAALLLIGLSGCYYDNEEELYQYYYQQNACDTSSISFSGDIFPIIQGNCATVGCHVAGGSAPGIFSNYAGVMDKVNNGSFENRVLIQRDMPPAGALTDCQINLIQAWLNAGAPDN